MLLELVLLAEVFLTVKVHQFLVHKDLLIEAVCTNVGPVYR